MRSKRVFLMLAATLLLTSALVVAGPGVAPVQAYTCDNTKGGSGTCGTNAWIKRVVNGTVMTYKGSTALNGALSEVTARQGSCHSFGATFFE